MKAPLLFAVVVALVATGCGPKEKSYAELLAIYNSELELLEKMEAERDKRVAEYEATLRPSEADAIKALMGMKEEMGEGLVIDATDPNELLDQAIGSAEEIQARTDELLAQAAATGDAAGADLTEQYSEEFKAKLADMNAKIEEQKTRVEKARQAKEAATAE